MSDDQRNGSILVRALLKWIVIVVVFLAVIYGAWFAYVLWAIYA